MNSQVFFAPYLLINHEARPEHRETPWDNFFGHRSISIRSQAMELQHEGLQLTAVSSDLKGARLANEQGVGVWKASSETGENPWENPWKKNKNPFQKPGNPWVLYWDWYWDWYRDSFRRWLDY